jgi:hypothetical protein
MQPDSASAREFDALLEKMCEQQLTDLEQQRLEDFLRLGETWQQRYLSYVNLHATLWLVEGNASTLSAPQDKTLKNMLALVSGIAPATSTASEESSGWATTSKRERAIPTLGFLGGMIRDLRFYLHTPAVLALLAVALFVGALGGRWLNQDIAQGPTQTEAVTPVAYLTSANGCAWGDGSPQMHRVGGGVLLGDEVTLHEGIAEFRLSSNVSLSIEGPAALVVTSPTSLILQHGKMTVYVPWAVADFRLVAGSCRLTACDAEFGVHVAGGEVDIHSFSGQILAVPAIDGEQRPELIGTRVIEQESELASGSEFSKVMVSAGRGLALANQGETIKVTKWHAADTSQFATKLSMAGRLPVAESYVRSVLESEPIHYWRFEKCESDLIENEVEGATALEAIGDLRLVGDSANHVVELGRPGSNLYLRNVASLNLPGSPDYSVELWLKPSHVHDGVVLSLNGDYAADEKVSVGFGLELWGPQQSYPAYRRNRMRLLHRDPPSSNVRTGTACYSSIPHSVRRWQHVVATKHGTELQLYFDGVSVSSGSDSSPLSADLQLLIGQWGTVGRICPFVGQMDELAIYGHALSEAEINEHVKALDWEPARASLHRKDEI